MDLSRKFNVLQVAANIKMSWTRVSKPLVGMWVGSRIASLRNSRKSQCPMDRNLDGLDHVLILTPTMTRIHWTVVMAP